MKWLAMENVHVEGWKDRFCHENHVLDQIEVKLYFFDGRLLEGIKRMKSKRLPIT